MSHLIVLTAWIFSAKVLEWKSVEQAKRFKELFLLWLLVLALPFWWRRQRLAACCLLLLCILATVFVCCRLLCYCSLFCCSWLLFYGKTAACSFCIFCCFFGNAELYLTIYAVFCCFFTAKKCAEKTSSHTEESIVCSICNFLLL